MNTDPKQNQSELNSRIGADTYSSILDEIPPIYYRAPVFLIAAFCVFLLVFLFVFQTQRVISAEGSFISQDDSIALIADYDCKLSEVLVKVGDKIAQNTDILLVEPILGTDNPKLLKKDITLLKSSIKTLQQGIRILSKIDRNSNMIGSYKKIVIENSKVNNFVSKLLKVHIQLEHLSITLSPENQVNFDLLQLEKKQLISNLKSMVTQLDLDLDLAKSQLKTYENNLRLLQLKIYNSYVKSKHSGVIVELDGDRSATINSGQVIARILPSSAKLTVTAKVQSAHIHLVDLGNKAYIKLKSYPFQKFGIISGTISKISPHLGDAKHFLVDIEPDETSLSVDNTTINMYPGLHANIEILTKKQAVINFFIKIKNTVGEI